MTSLLRGAEVQELRELRQQGLSITEIGRLTGISRDTVRKCLRDPRVPVYGPREAASRRSGRGLSLLTATGASSSVGAAIPRSVPARIHREGP